MKIIDMIKIRGVLKQGGFNFRVLTQDIWEYLKATTSLRRMLLAFIFIFPMLYVLGSFNPQNTTVSPTHMTISLGILMIYLAIGIQKLILPIPRRRWVEKEYMTATAN